MVWTELSHRHRTKGFTSKASLFCDGTFVECIRLSVHRCASGERAVELYILLSHKQHHWKWDGAVFCSVANPALLTGQLRVRMLCTMCFTSRCYHRTPQCILNIIPSYKLLIISRAALKTTIKVCSNCPVGCTRPLSGQQLDMSGFLRSC